MYDIYIDVLQYVFLFVYLFSLCLRLSVCLCLSLFFSLSLGTFLKRDFGVNGRGTRRTWSKVFCHHFFIACFKLYNNNDKSERHFYCI